MKRRITEKKMRSLELDFFRVKGKIHKCGDGLWRLEAGRWERSQFSKCLTIAGYDADSIYSQQHLDDYFNLNKR